MKIAVGQFAPTADTAENLRTMRRLTEQAAAGGAQLVVFPGTTHFFGLAKTDLVLGAVLPFLDAPLPEGQP